MSEQAGGSSEAHSSGDRDSPLDRAAAGGPISWVDSSDGDQTGNAEPAGTHDSPAGVEEERAADPGAPGDDLAGPDRLTSIYGPPPGDRA